MVTPRQYSSYDPALSQLFEAASERPVTLTFPTELDARRQRKQLYAFRDAIEHDKKAAPNLKVIAKLLSFKLNKNKVVIFRPRHVKLERNALAEVQRQKQENGE